MNKYMMNLITDKYKFININTFKIFKNLFTESILKKK